MSGPSAWSDPQNGMTAGIGPGARVGGYVLKEQIGKGGMAMVFRALEENLGRSVAVKVMAPELAADAAFRARFLRESRAIASVHEPHILPVYSAGESDDLLFIATRFVSGGDLGGLLRRNGGFLDSGKVAGLVSQVASALDAAHAAGLVHRDVKPGNILVEKVPGQPEHMYLGDFGIAKWSSTTKLTASGELMGTPEYCAPEQFRGGPFDGRTDQYALACVAFVLLTGSLPFAGRDLASLMYAHLEEPVPAATSIHPDLPPAVNPVLARAMSKNPQGRYASCGDFAASLLTALTPASDPFPWTFDDRPAPPQPDPISRSMQSTITKSNPETSGAPPRRSLASPSRRIRVIAKTHPRRTRVVAFGALVALSGALAFVSPHIFTSSGPTFTPAGSYGSTVKASLVATLVTPSDPAYATAAPAFEPGGETLATASYGHIYLWDASTGKLVGSFTNPDGGGFDCVAFAPDGKTLVVGTDRTMVPGISRPPYGGVYLLDASTGKLIADLTSPASVVVDSIAFAPDSKTFATIGTGGENVDLWDVETESKRSNFDSPTGIDYNSLSFAPNGKTIAAGFGQDIYLLNAFTGELTASFTAPGPGSDFVSVAFAPSGQTLAVWDDSGVYLVNVTTGKSTGSFPAPPENGISSVAFAPDGKTLAASYDNGDTRLWNITTKQLVGTFADAGDFVAFAPDGKTVAISGNGHTYLWRITGA